MTRATVPGAVDTKVEDYPIYVILGKVGAAEVAPKGESPRADATVAKVESYAP